MQEVIRKPPTPKIIRWFISIIAVLVTIFSLLLYRYEPPLLREIEGQLIDARFQLRGAEAVTGSVAIVAIDDRSLDEIARWPWSRYVIADLISSINQAGAAVVTLDMVFSEPQAPQMLKDLKRTVGLDEQTLNKISNALATSSPDQYLADVMGEYGNIIGGYYFYFSTASKTLSPQLGQQQLAVEKGGVAAVRSKAEQYEITEAYGAVKNLPLFVEAVHSVGYFNALPDRDGVVRQVPLLTRYFDNLYPSLAVQALAAAYGGAPVVVLIEEFGISHFSIEGDNFETNEVGRMMLNYRGPERTIPTYSAVDVLNGTLEEGALTDKIIFLGVPAIGVGDRRSTPFGVHFPGVEIQATVLENLLAGDALKENALADALDIATMILMVLLNSLILPMLKNLSQRLLFAATVLISYIFINYYFFTQLHQVVNLIYPLISWFLIVGLINAYLGLTVERTASSVRHAFKSYLHPGIVDQLAQNPEQLTFGGEERVLSILFSDIRNFTNLSEGISPGELSHFLRCYMDPMTEEVLENRGTLDKYIGDAVMAFYGAPYPNENHAQYACKSALGMIERLNTLGDNCPELAHLFPIKIGIGIHSGKVMVGNFGSSLRFNYTVLGDGVNLASRLEGMSKAYGVNIVVSESTKQLVEGQFIFRELDLVRVKGKEVPVRIYELITHKEGAYNQPLLNNWSVALTLYHQQQWQSAAQQFESVQAIIGREDKACQLYLERITRYTKAPPPENWDGVFTFSSK